MDHWEMVYMDIENWFESAIGIIGLIAIVLFSYSKYPRTTSAIGCGATLYAAYVHQWSLFYLVVAGVFLFMFKTAPEIETQEEKDRRYVFCPMCGYGHEEKPFACHKCEEQLNNVSGNAKRCINCRTIMPIWRNECHRCNTTQTKKPVTITKKQKIKPTEFNKRVLCSDSSCIGTLDEDGYCKECKSISINIKKDEPNSPPPLFYVQTIIAGGR